MVQHSYTVTHGRWKMPLSDEDGLTIPVLCTLFWLLLKLWHDGIECYISWTSPLKAIFLHRCPKNNQHKKKVKTKYIWLIKGVANTNFPLDIWPLLLYWTERNCTEFWKSEKITVKGKTGPSVTLIGGKIFIFMIDLFWYNSLGSSHKTL